MKYRVKIKNPNKMFIINNRPVRSPLQCFINEDELSMIKSRIKFYGLNDKDYEIDEVIDNEEEKKDYSVIRPKREADKTIREEKNFTSNQEQLHKDINKTSIKPKQKILTKKEVIVHQKQNIITPNNIMENNSTNSNLNIEQIINDKIENSSDVEVKIEELTVKSSSILQKFLESEF